MRVPPVLKPLRYHGVRISFNIFSLRILNLIIEMKKKKYHTIGIVQYSNRKIDTPNTHNFLELFCSLRLNKDFDPLTCRFFSLLNVVKIIALKLLPAEFNFIRFVFLSVKISFIYMYSSSPVNITSFFFLDKPRPPIRRQRVKDRHKYHNIVWQGCRIRECSKRTFVPHFESWGQNFVFASLTFFWGKALR